MIINIVSVELGETEEAASVDSHYTLRAFAVPGKRMFLHDAPSLDCVNQYMLCALHATRLDHVSDGLRGGPWEQHQSE